MRRPHLAISVVCSLFVAAPSAERLCQNYGGPRRDGDNRVLCTQVVYHSLEDELVTVWDLHVKMYLQSHTPRER